MVKKIIYIAPFLRPVLLTFAALLAGCQPEAPLNLPEFNAEKAYSEVEDLVKISPRDAGTTGGLRAAEHIFHRLRSFGIEAEIDTFNDQCPNNNFNVIPFCNAALLLS